ncbi:hypothetical protein NN6n1_01920 [Shinella zoogloeoides]
MAASVVRDSFRIKGALSLVASLPTLLVFLFFQRYFIKGMTMGAVKG